MKRKFALTSATLFTLLSFVTFYAMAQDVTAPQDFLAQVLETIAKFGGLSIFVKVSVVITLIIASMKVSILNDLIWSKLGQFKAWVAPILGLVAGILGLFIDGHTPTPQSIFAYISAGAGAIILHELLDTIKAIPGIGSTYVMIINIIEGALGGPKKT